MPRCLRLALEVGEQARLPDARVAHDQHRPADARRRASIEQGAQPAALRRRDRRRCRRPASGARSTRPARPPPRGRAAGPAPTGRAARPSRGRRRPGVPRRADGRLVEEDLARPGERLDPGRGRDRRPGQGQVVASRDRAARRDHLAGGDPDPDLHRLGAVAQVAQRRSDRERGERRPDRVVVVGAGPAEDREDRVADELLARAVEAFDGVGHRRRAARTRRRTTSGSCSATIRT